jgi:rhamnosyltransferase
MFEKQPSVLILLATHNGASFIEELIESILAQVGVELKILISDDNSKDNTIELIEGLNSKYIEILDVTKIGSAAGNFFRLINLCEHDFDYFAFADQDDIWKNNKLIKAINKLKSTRSSGYSSSFQYFWGSDLSSAKYFSKGSKLTKIDYLFSSPGPGCTFVLDRNLFMKIKRQISINRKLYEEVSYHDWAIYATARGLGYNWEIDKNSYLYYRQHSNNEIGVNRTLKGAFNRLKRITSKWYESEILKIIDILNSLNDPNIKWMSSLNFLKEGKKQNG